jgi:cytochrome c oxidase subunit 2
LNTRYHFDQLFSLYLTVAAIVFGIVVVVLFFGVVHYRAGRGHEPSPRTQHKVLESIVAMALIGAASFLAVNAASANASERNGLGQVALAVRITGFQWCWSFYYPKSKVTTRGNCKQHIPTLVVPTGEVIGFSLTSSDVVHEWWLPYARWKEEAFPDHYNYFKLRFAKSGRWEGRCDEFCGLYHDRMEFYVKAEPKAAFDRWLAKQAARKAS